MYDCVQSTGVMILAEEKQSRQRKTYPSALLSNIDPTPTRQRSNPWLHGSKRYSIVNDNIENGTNMALQLNTTCTKLHAVVNQMTTVNTQFTLKLIMLIQSPIIVDKANDNPKAPRVRLTVLPATYSLSTSSECSVTQSSANHLEIQQF